MHDFIFRAGYFLKRPGVMRHYRDFQRSQWQSFGSLRDQQEQQLRKLMDHVYENVFYYTKLFDELGLRPDDIATVEDLVKLPVLTKQTIKQNWQDFIPKNMDKLKYMNGSTGGSTGEPFTYRISAEDYERGVSLLYRGLGYGGYRPGDKLAVIAGSSLIPTTKSESKKRIQDFVLNFRHYSSFEMNQENLLKYFHDINKWKPSFLRGYASSIHLFARFISDNALELEAQPKGIFTTAEKLFARQRELIERVFGAKVYDNYGLNDGGVSAYECEEHCGMHIDMERAILEVVDDGYEQTINQKGNILATSLYNYALPFIRYETGDLGVASDSKCACGRETLLLKEIIGRIQEFVLTPSGLKIHGEFFTHIFRTARNVSQFQVIQNKTDEILVRIVPDHWQMREDVDTNRIRDIVARKDKELKVRIELVSARELEYTEAGKHRFIINLTELDDKQAKNTFDVK